jgi:anti-sigma B factor antagonist
MKLDIEHTADVMVVRIASDSLDAGSVEEFRKQVLPLISEARKVILDMSLLNFVDSAGLGSILACLKAVRQSQGELKLCALTRPVRALFELMRMQKVFSIYATRDEALKSF